MNRCRNSRSGEQTGEAVEHRMVDFGAKAAANGEGMVVTAEDLAVNVVDMAVIVGDMAVIEVVLVAIAVVRAVVEHLGGRKGSTTVDSRVGRRSGRNVRITRNIHNVRSVTAGSRRSGSNNAKAVKGEERPSRVHQAPAHSRSSMPHNQGRSWVAVHRRECASTVKKQATWQESAQSPSASAAAAAAAAVVAAAPAMTVGHLRRDIREARRWRGSAGY